VVIVYILRCRDNGLYVGMTDNLAARVERHNRGKGCAFTAVRQPVTVAYSEVCPTRAAAAARERQIKRWTRAKKEALIAGDLWRLKQLSARRSM
jgi:predicted GIY-YIG superfamily endonuclease